MKTVQEISVKLENKPGKLAEVTDLLGANGINILGLTVRTEGPAGVLHFVATDPARVLNILDSGGYSASTNDVLAAEVPSHPGGLNALLKPLKLAGVNVEYLYSCIGCHSAGDGSIMLLAVDNLDKAYEALLREWIKLYGQELYDF